MRQLATVRMISDIRPIEGADKIEVAQIDGWQVVIPKGQFRVGDKCLYFEIDSFLPVRPEYEFLLKGNAPKKMLYEGKEIEGIRLKTIKLRGQISQGLVLPLPDGCPDEGDASEYLGVVKYEAPISAQLSGVAKGNFPYFIPKTDEERIQNMKFVFERWYVTEKLDGSSVTMYKKSGMFGVCSRNLELVEGDSSPWKAAKELEMADKLPDNMAIQGELVGEGIQGNPLKLSGQHFFAYNLYNIQYEKYLDFHVFVELCDKIGVKTVPILDQQFILLNTVDEILAYAEGMSALNPECEREGVVVRPLKERTYGGGARMSFKAISNKYLLSQDQ